MLTWLASNIGTIIVCLAIAGIAALIIIKAVKNRQEGSDSACRGGCCGCPYSKSGKCCNDKSK